MDANLIEQVKEGDRMAFRKLVEKYKDVSFTLACSILKDETKAEDALQEAFIKVYQKAHTFKHQSAFSSWLYRIVVNTSYNELKKNKRHPLGEVIHKEWVDQNETASQLMKEDEQRKYILMALETLTPDQALVLRLFYLCEFSLKEIADITNFSISKIKVNLYRGRLNMEMALKELLGGQLHDLL